MQGREANRASCRLYYAKNRTAILAAKREAYIPKGRKPAQSREARNAKRRARYASRVGGLTRVIKYPKLGEAKPIQRVRVKKGQDGCSGCTYCDRGNDADQI